MTKAIELAREAGFTFGAFIWAATDKDIERFYTMCRADLEAEIEKLREALKQEPVLARTKNPKYPWSKAYDWDKCPACFEAFDMEPCDHCGDGHPDQYIQQPAQQEARNVSPLDHTEKLLARVERPEPVLWQYANTETVTTAMVGYKPAPTWKPLYTADQLQVFAASAALKAREKALEEAKGACLDLMMVNSVSGYSGLGPIDIFHQSVGICTNSIEALNA